MSAETGAGAVYVRLCPSCGEANAQDVIRCKCGAMLFGLDLVRAESLASPAAMPAAAPAAKPEAPAALTCPHADCGQVNPAGSVTCVYCNRPLAQGAAEAPPPPRGVAALPATLASRFRLVRLFDARGAEAEIFLVEPAAGGARAIVKVYRLGIAPKAEVQKRIAAIPERHRVGIAETGVADGHAYEVMEFCAGGSLRERFADGPPAPAEFRAIVGDLAGALQAVHAQGLVHRDIKPDNVLVRSREPLELVLTDFGTASVVDATQRFTGTARTLLYSPPESLSGVFDTKADYWAMGMLLLEATLGRHPFAGLSEQVILYHLTTRSIDLTAVAEPEVRKLLRGLLLRDPKRRWGAAEVGRWLARDASLAEPVEQGQGAGFERPYRLGDAVCGTPEQLAVALSRNWRAGIVDLTNGQLLAWFRDVQKDQNTVRLMLEMQHERQMHVDRQMLKLILHLATGLPPVWRGESIEPQAILSRANLALKGDADAAHWLDTLYQHRVLEEYAAVGHPGLTDMVRRWTGMVDRFEKVWPERTAWIVAQRKANPDHGAVAIYDNVVYGQDPLAMPRPKLVHLRLLALAYAPAWAAKLRQQVAAELAGLAVHFPPLAAWGAPKDMDAANLVVLERLLPELRELASRGQRAADRAREGLAQQANATRAALESSLAAVRSSLGLLAWSGSNVEEVGAALHGYFEAVQEIRSSGRTDEAWEALRRDASRFEAVNTRLRVLADSVAVIRARNAGWFSLRMMVFLVITVSVIHQVANPGANAILIMFIAAFAAWRVLPLLALVRQMRELGQRLG